MHKLTLNIEDSAIDKLINFLKNLPKNEVEIVEDISFVKNKKKVAKLRSVALKIKKYKFDRDEANA